jgi:hypothetical protein
MAFAHPSKPFTQAQVEAINPSHSGVYGLLRADAWIYIGRGNIRERLLGHLHGDHEGITQERPTHWAAEVTPNQVNRERELVIELYPICNQEVEIPFRVPQKVAQG